MKSILTAALLALGLAGAADAATRTYQVVFSDVVDNNGALEALDADTSATELVFSWTVDTAAAPIQGPFNYSGSLYSFQYAILPYTSLSVSIGGASLTGLPSTGTNERVMILDGVSDGTGDIFDYYQVGSFSDQTLSNGTRINEMYFFAFNYDEGTISGLDQPTTQELSALGDGGFSVRISLLKANGQRASIVGNSVNGGNIAVVPVPASMPLLLGALLVLGFCRRRS